MSRAAERSARRITRFWAILGGLAALVAGLILATMASIVVIFTAPTGIPREAGYCNATGLGRDAGIADRDIEYRKEGFGGFPPGERCGAYLVADPLSALPPRLVAHSSYPGSEQWVWILVCLLSPLALWATLIAISEASATRSRR